MGYHSGLNGEYNIPVEVNSKHIAHFRRCCKEEVPEKAIKVETYLTPRELMSELLRIEHELGRVREIKLKSLFTK